MYEKGLGLTKDLQEARRLYLAAADKGNAKAMHNLAVLYAEGIDGKPDYAVASHWFRKAAGYGIVDSQYNLAILYARGIGVERTWPKSYKWFALAAKGGDKDAARKRDEIASHLDARNWKAQNRPSKPLCRSASPTRRSPSRRPPAAGIRSRWPPREQDAALTCRENKLTVRPQWADNARRRSLSAGKPSLYPFPLWRPKIAERLPRRVRGSRRKSPRHRR